MSDVAVKTVLNFIRDVAMIIVAAFILVHETVENTNNPDPILIGAALTLLGVPAALRADAQRREKQ
jgi:hypothetical protein